MKYSPDEWEVTFRERKRKEMRILTSNDSNIFMTALSNAPMLGNIKRGVNNIAPMIGNIVRGKGDANV
jgi:hypothetical protein